MGNPAGAYDKAKLFKEQNQIHQRNSICRIRSWIAAGAQIRCLFEISSQSFLLMSGKVRRFTFNFLAISVFFAKFES